MLGLAVPIGQIALMRVHFVIVGVLISVFLFFCTDMESLFVRRSVLGLGNCHAVFSDIVSSPEESFVIMSCGMLGIALQTLLELEPRTRLRGPWGSVVKYGSIAS